MTLADRIEALEGPDRGIDVEIAQAAGWHVLYDAADSRDRTPYYQPTPGMSWRPVPTFTASLDAAMTLVPEGAWFVLKNVMGAQPMNRDWFQADVLHDGYKDRPIKLTRPYPTPALALVAAALRAMEATDGQ